MKYVIQNQADLLGFEFRRSVKKPAESPWLLGYEQGYRQALFLQIRMMKYSAELNNCWPLVREALKRGVKSVNKKTK